MTNTGYTNVYDKRPAENCTSSVFSLFQYKMTFDKDFLKKGYHFLTSTNFFFVKLAYVNYRYIKYLFFAVCRIYANCCFNPLRVNFTKWSNLPEQLVGNLPTNCLSVFGHFVELTLKGLRLQIKVT